MEAWLHDRGNVAVAWFTLGCLVCFWLLFVGYMLALIFYPSLVCRWRGHDAMRVRGGGFFCRRCHAASDYSAWQEGYRAEGQLAGKDRAGHP